MRKFVAGLAIASVFSLAGVAFADGVFVTDEPTRSSVPPNYGQEVCVLRTMHWHMLDNGKWDVENEQVTVPPIIFSGPYVHRDCTVFCTVAGQNLGISHDPHFDYTYGCPNSVAENN